MQLMTNTRMLIPKVQTHWTPDFEKGLLPTNHDQNINTFKTLTLQFGKYFTQFNSQVIEKYWLAYFGGKSDQKRKHMRSALFLKFTN